MFHVEQTEFSSTFQCLLCDNKQFTKNLTVKDHFLSGETFELICCSHCGLISTTPGLKEEDLWKYYKSENYISHSSKAGTTFEKIYQAVRNYTISKKVKLISRYSRGKNILDIGCATGEFLNACRQHGFSVEGIEPNENARQIALQNHNLSIHGLEMIKSLSDNSFDVITLWHVLEHVPDLNERMKQISRLLKPDGTVFLALPNHESFDAKHYREFWAAYDVPRHIFHFNKKSLAYLANKFNFVVSDILPMKFDSFYVSLLSEKYKTGKSSVVSAVYFGLLSNFKARGIQPNHSSLIYVLKKK